eukprot:g38255.t1
MLKISTIIFEGHGAGENPRVGQMLTCTFANVVYCIRCSQCGLLYIVMNHFNSSSYSLDDMSILGLFQCHNNATQKLEEQHLIFCLGSLQPNGLNV